VNTPLIMIPQINEQRLVAKRVQDLGAGIALNRKNLNARMIRGTVFCPCGACGEDVFAAVSEWFRLFIDSLFVLKHRLQRICNE
jgi:hypothetical protein